MSEAILADCLERLAKRGFDHAEARVTASEKDELQAEYNTPSMLRSVRNVSVSLRGIVDDKRASVNLNKLDDESLADAVEELWKSAQAAPADAANAISEAQPAARFANGDDAADLDAMCDRLDEFLDYTTTTFPTLTLGVAGVSHNRGHTWYANSNGVALESRRGRYDAQAMFTAKEGEDVSSFSYSGVSLDRLDQPIADTASFARLMRGATEHVRTRKVPAKFTGDLIITPDCAGSFLGFLLNNISTGPMVSGTSIYADKLGVEVTSPVVTLSSRPLDQPGGYFLTDDGYPAENATIVEDGVLKSNLLDLYGARKTGKDRARTGGGCYDVVPGTESLASLIKSVRQGVLITRFSGGRPSEKGDFSGVAKNSFYIENGEVQFPLSETMVSGNLADVLMNIEAVSKERVNFGSSHYPWFKATGIGIS